MIPLLLDKSFEQWEMGKVPSYRLEQVRKWVFEHGCLDWSKMTNLPQSLRDEISQIFDLVPMELIRTQGSSDTTRKLLWKLRDNQLIESVLIPISRIGLEEATNRAESFSKSAATSEARAPSDHSG